MAIKAHPRPSASQWMQAKGLHAPVDKAVKGPLGALVPAAEDRNDHIAVVYDRGDTPPEITVHAMSGSVHKVCANGVAVAIVASASAPAPRADEVLLVERAF